jgi:hypothetical protein
MQGGACVGYLSSIIDIQTSGSAVNGKKACIPLNADMNQIVDLFKNYVRDSYVHLHDDIGQDDGINQYTLSGLRPRGYSRNGINIKSSERDLS